MEKRSISSAISYYSDVRPVDVKWLWYPYIPYGKLTILQGDPGDGKSSMMMNLIGRASSGRNMPDGTPIEKPIKVIYQCSEDGAADTIRPRLDENGAICGNVAFINENDKLLTMDDCRIRDAIIELGAKLLVIDPIQAYIGNDGDLNNASKARKILQTLSHWAAAFGCAVVLVGHLNKRDNGKELYRSLGSIDVVASARSVLQVHRSEDDPNIRVLHHVKSSLAPRGKDAYFQIAEKGAVLWQDDCKNMVLGNEANQCPVPDKEENKQDVVCAALCDLLKDGEKSAQEIRNYFDEKGIGRTTVNQIKRRIGIASFRKEGIWYWKLPQ